MTEEAWPVAAGAGAAAEFERLYGRTWKLTAYFARCSDDQVSGDRHA
jgi:hypothetical protein